MQSDGITKIEDAVGRLGEKHNNAFLLTYPTDERYFCKLGSL